jgi:NADP-dependent 3-hydroxy acid dehydrogenase YdfG
MGAMNNHVAIVTGSSSGIGRATAIVAISRYFLGLSEAMILLSQST